jgi:hypothetical protein
MRGMEWPSQSLRILYDRVAALMFFFRDWNMCCCVALPGSDSIENQLANWSNQGFLSMALCFRWTDSVVIGRKLLTSRRPLLAPETPRFSTRTFHIHCSQFRGSPQPVRQQLYPDWWCHPTVDRIEVSLNRISLWRGAVFSSIGLPTWMFVLPNRANICKDNIKHL